MNKKLIIAGSTILLLALIAYLARDTYMPAPVQPTPTAQVADLVTPLIADARVVPIRSAALSLSTSGIVAELLVDEGDSVNPGQILLRLDQSHEQARVNNAQAALAESEASLERLLAGATAEEIAIAEAQLRQAQAQATMVNNSVTPQDLKAAQAQINQAQATLNRLANTPKDSDKRASVAQLAQAEQNLSMQRDQLSAAKTSAELRMRQATNTLVQAQTQYATARSNWEEVERTGRDPINPNMTDPANPTKTKSNKLNDAQKQQYYDAYVNAEAALHSAEQAVEEAKVAYDTARQAEVDGVKVAEQQLIQAQASNERAMQGPEADEWAAARAQLAAGQATLARLRGAERASSVEAAQAGVEVAAASLERLQAPPPESEIALARTRVQAAQAELDQALLALADTELRAPFAGTIAAVEIEQSVFLSAGSIVLRLADFSAWKIETVDLTELNISEVQPGAPVTVSFDALPGVELKGIVSHIAPFGEIRQGDITYTATITPEQHDSRLYWNMTATLAIMPGR